MNDIEFQINEMSLKIICLESELEDCIAEERIKQNDLDNIQARVEYAEKVCVDLCFGKQSEFIKENLTGEQISNIKMIIDSEN